MIKNILNKLLFWKKDKVNAQFTNEDRMNITDPDWREDLAIRNSYKWIALGIVGLVMIIMLIWSLTSYFNCDVFQLIEKVYHHLIPHIPTDGKDIIKS